MKRQIREAVLQHLSAYKRSELGITELGIYVGSDKRVHKKAHILPKTKQLQNLLPLCRPSSTLDVPFKLHRYFHHLNSSQALCINLFEPLAKTEKLRPILRHLQISGTKEPVGTFEKESDREHVRADQRRTSFDFHLAGHQGPEVFFEVKYTEDGFGTAVNDDEHREKVEEIYRPLVKESPYLTSKAKKPDQPFVDFFLKHYQLMRNLVHMDRAAHLVLLFPSWNERVRVQAEHAREEFLTPQGRERLHLLHLEDVVAFLTKQTREDRQLSRHYAEFRRKYLPDLGNVT